MGADVGEKRCMLREVAGRRRADLRRTRAYRCGIDTAMASAAATTMTVSLDAVAVTDAPCFDTKPVADFEVTPAFSFSKSWRSTLDESHVGNKSGSIVLVTQIWPYDVVEDVCLQGGDGAWQSGYLLWSWA